MKQLAIRIPWFRKDAEHDPLQQYRSRLRQALRAAPSHLIQYAKVDLPYKSGHNSALIRQSAINDVELPQL